jgi:hypothetical protein
MLCRTEQSEAEGHAEIIRLSLEELHRLALDGTLSNNRVLVPPAALWNLLRTMSPEDRREYINNVLVSRVSRIFQIIWVNHSFLAQSFAFLYLSGNIESFQRRSTHR